MTKRTDVSSTLRSDQLSPHSPEAEEAVLGSVLLNPECLAEVHWLKPDDFFIVRHGWIWEAYQRLKARKEPLDYLTVVNELETQGRLAETGGAAYVLSLINKTPSALNVEGYGHIVEGMFARRDLIAAAEDIARLAHSDSEELSDVLRAAGRRLDDVILRHMNKECAVVTAQEAAGELWEEAVRWHGDPGKLRGMCTGLEPIDRLARGFRRNKLYYLCARPGMGKSALLARIARGLAAQGYKVLFYALEMSAFEMVARMACQLTNLKWDDVEAGTLSEDDHARYLDGVLQVGALGIAFDETSGLTIDEYWDRTTAYEKEHGPLDFVIMDTINCAQGIGDGDTAQMTQCSRHAKNWAHDRGHHYALMVSAQLNRSNEGQADKRPSLKAIRSSGALEEDGDIIWGIYRAGYYDKTIADIYMEVEVLKGRQYGAPVGSLCTTAWRGGCFGIERKETATVDLPPAPFIQASFAQHSTPEHYDP